MIREDANHRQARGAMLFSSIRVLVKIAVASLIVGTILSHFGITTDALLREAGVTPERIADYGRRAFDWAAPNVLLGAIVIVPIWFVIYLFRPPGRSSE
jgi:diacylglycerol kinase